MLAPDLIMKNGKVITVDANFRIQQALALYQGKIVEVGSNSQVERMRGEETRVLDLQGKTVIPGIVDSHNHLIEIGQLLTQGFLLFHLETIEDLLCELEKEVKKRERGEWIIGGSWIESQFTSFQAPERQELDTVSPDHPVVLFRLFGGLVANSQALDKAGIHRGSRHPYGLIQKDDQGEPTGLLMHGAEEWVKAQIPKPPPSEGGAHLEAAITAAGREYVKCGITTIVDPGVTQEGMQAYWNLHQKRKLPLRVNMMPALYGLYSYESQEMADWVRGSGFSSGFGDHELNLGALKMALDGGLGSKSAWMKEPWLDETMTTLPLRLELESLPRYLQESHSQGWSVGIHCCGDRAQEEALAGFKECIREIEREHRHSIIHGYFATSQTMDAMARYGISVSAQPGFLFVEGDLYFQHISREKARTFTPLKSYLEHGVRVACNSDAPSNHYHPFLGMEAALFRETSRGESLGCEEALRIQEVLPLFTRESAFLAFLDQSVGSLEKGKEADLVVLQGDLLSPIQGELRRMEVHMTLIRGQIVYSDGTFSSFL